MEIALWLTCGIFGFVMVIQYIQKKFDGRAIVEIQSHHFILACALGKISLFLAIIIIIALEAYFGS